MKLKKILTRAAALITAFAFGISAFADVDVNLDSADSAALGTGEKGVNVWTVYDENGYKVYDEADGLRVTIYDASDNSQVSSSIDITGYSAMANVSDLGHFESSTGNLISKTAWLGVIGAYYSAVDDTSKKNFNNRVVNRLAYGGYSVKYVSELSGLTIVSENNTANLEAIKETLGNDRFIQDLCDLYNNAFSYEDFKSGKYKISFEPIAYFTYGGVSYALTATECGLLNHYLVNLGHNGDGVNLKAKIGNVTHSMLPRSAFLTKKDLGIPPYQPTDSDYYFYGESGYNSDICIIRCMGIGVLSGTAGEEEDLPDGTGNADYHTDTKVYTSFEFTNTSVNSNHFVKYILSKTTKTLENVDKICYNWLRCSFDDDRDVAMLLHFNELENKILQI